MNDRIRVPEIRLIGEDGHSYGVLPIEEARRLADEQNLDLVEVSPNAAPPVVKLIDYGKYLYQEQKRQAEAKKKQVTIALKEIQFRPNIDNHDLEVKLKRIKEFLEDGDKVKLQMQFRGREMSNKEIGLDKFRKILESVVALGGVVENELKMMGNRAIVMVASTFKKKPSSHGKNKNENKNESD